MTLASKKLSWCFLPSLPVSDSPSLPPTQAGASAHRVPLPPRRATGAGGAGASACGSTELGLVGLGIFFFSVCFDSFARHLLFGTLASLNICRDTPWERKSGKRGGGEAKLRMIPLKQRRTAQELGETAKSPTQE